MNDVAFAIGIVALAGRRIASGAKLYLPAHRRRRHWRHCGHIAIFYT
jgi:Na+/H+ antiporter NhaA